MNRFADFFTDKIKKIFGRISLRSWKRVQMTCAVVPATLIHLNFWTFTHAKKNEISKFIKRPTTKSCDLGRIPTWLLQLCLSEVLPVITHIVNAFFSSSEVPRQLKLALVIPLLKKGSNRTRDSKTIRPVSNLTYISKLIERVVADRLNVFYHKEISMKCSEVPTNSMETALLRVQNDLLDRKYKDYVYGRC